MSIALNTYVFLVAYGKINLKVKWQLPYIYIQLFLFKKPFDALRCFLINLLLMVI